MNGVNPSAIEIVATLFFVLAVLHTFMVNRISKFAHRFPKDSVGEELFHFLGEVEAVFGIWSLFFIIVYSVLHGFAIYDSGHQNVIGGAVNYINNINYTEPAFVFVIMCMAGTRPVIMMSAKVIELVSKILPLPHKMSFFVATLIIGPLLGSFITEPAAMTVTALILLENFYSKEMSSKFKYATLGLLFVNVSIGGTLTHFAAPPVLMVAAKWHWGMGHMLGHFGYKAAIAVILGTLLVAFRFKKELTGRLQVKTEGDNKLHPRWWINALHILFLSMVVLTAHHPKVFMGVFLFFIGFAVVTKEYQHELKIKESLLVGFFLAGLVTLGSMQRWWLQPTLAAMSDLVLYLGATGLTAITDNAALTYLGSLVDLSDSAKYFMVAGAVTGGGLTVIANAPNPAGFGILKESFGEGGISPLGLFLAACFPTFLALLAFKFLPSIAFLAH